MGPYKKLDKIFEEIDKCRKEPDFTNQISLRTSNLPNTKMNENELFENMAILICFSQNAKSDPVDKMIKKPEFKEIFNNFDVDSVANMNPNVIISEYWDLLKPIRFKSKISSIVKCAVLLSSGQFDLAAMLKNIPVRVQTQDDIKEFWKNFIILREELKKIKMPFYGNTTSLLHLLLYLGYDCIKPDTIVMKVAINDLNIVTGKSDNDLIKVVTFVQEYAIYKHIRPAIVDFYLLIYGGQTWAKQFIIC